MTVKRGGSVLNAAVAGFLLAVIPAIFLLIVGLLLGTLVMGLSQYGPSFSDWMIGVLLGLLIISPLFIGFIFVNIFFCILAALITKRIGGKWLLVALAILLLIPLIALVVYYTPSYTKDCDSIHVGEERDNCYFEKAVLGDDVSLCRKIGREGDKGQCVWDVGVSSHNLAICDEMINSGDYARQRYQGCYAAVGVALQNVSVCGRISPNQGNGDETGASAKKAYMTYCYRGIAVSNKDESICEKIDSTEERDKSDCFEDVAIAKKDSSICGKIQPGWGIKEMCYRRIALASDESSPCDNTNDYFNKDVCYAVVKKDESVCEKIDDSQRYDCYARVAAVKKDKAICNKLNSGSQIGDCYRRFNIYSGFDDKLLRYIGEFGPPFII